MSCPCGNTRCVCEDGCYCHQVNCMCSNCQYLEKLCSRCSLPFYVIIASKEDIERQVCCCDDQEFTFYAEDQSNQQTSAAARGNQLSIAPVRRDKCPRCNLPVLIITTAEDRERRVQYCCCSNKNPSTNIPGVTTEHETSNCTSDHREVSADRQGRKILSRKIRTKKSNWQAKKVKEHSSNSAEDCSNTDIVDAEDFPPETSSPGRVRDDEKQNISRSSPFGDMSTAQNFNPDSNTQSPAGNTSKAGESSTGKISLLVDTSGAPNPCASKSSSLGFFQSNENVRPNLPHPFPRLPKPLPGPPALFKQLGRLSHLQFKRWTSHEDHPFPVQQSAARAVKMEKWFETIQQVLNTSGELPDAETAAALDEEDKKQLEKELEDKSGNQPGEKQVEQHRYPLRSRQTQRQISLADDQNNGKNGDDNEPTTDTNRSTSLSKSHKESESD